MTQFLYRPFSLHCATSRPENFYVLQFLGFVSFGVSCAFAVFVLLHSLIDVLGVASVEATIHAE